MPAAVLPLHPTVGYWTIPAGVMPVMKSEDGMARTTPRLPSRLQTSSPELKTVPTVPPELPWQGRRIGSLSWKLVGSTSHALAGPPTAGLRPQTPPGVGLAAVPPPDVGKGPGG